MREGKPSPRFGSRGLHTVSLQPLMLKLYGRDDAVLATLTVVETLPDGTKTVLHDDPKQIANNFPEWVEFLGAWVSRREEAPQSAAKMDIAVEQKRIHALAVNDAKWASRGCSLNPFTTQGSRNLWQQGWDGVRPANLTDGSDHWIYWERGVQAHGIAREAEVATERQRG